jgi:hypothetical protein
MMSFVLWFVGGSADPNTMKKKTKSHSPKSRTSHDTRDYERYFRFVNREENRRNPATVKGTANVNTTSRHLFLVVNKPVVFEVHGNSALFTHKHEIVHFCFFYQQCRIHSNEPLLKLIKFLFYIYQ